jgi:hypothetical protein
MRRRTSTPASCLGTRKRPVIPSGVCGARNPSSIPGSRHHLRLVSRSPAPHSTQMRPQKRQRTFPRLRRRLRIVIRPLVAIKSVPRLRVHKHRNFRMRLLYFLDFTRGNVLVFSPKMQHHRAARFLARKSCDLSSIVPNRRSRIQSCRRQPRQRSPITKANHADLAWWIALRNVLNGRANIQQRFLQSNLRGDLHAPRRVGRVVVQLDPWLDAIKQTRRNRREPLRRVIIRDCADMPVHAENLLNDDDCGCGSLGRFGQIRAKLVSIAGNQVRMRSHNGQRLYTLTGRFSCGGGGKPGQKIED